MPLSRTSMEQPAAVESAELLAQCVTAMARLDIERQFVWLNAALADWLGTAPSRWAGASLARLDPGESGIEAAAQRAQSERQVVILRQVGIRCDEHRHTPADIAFTPLADGGLWVEIHPQEARGERASPLLSESLRGFAHEVKNPLAGVRGAAQLLGRRVESAELRELAELIIAESDRLTALADRLLGTRGKPRLVRLNIHELLERVALLIAAEEGAPEVRRDYDPSLPAAVGDPDRLYQLLLNLARNAMEAGCRVLTLRSRVEFGVRLGERLRRAALRIDVHDDGCGVAASVATALYLPLVSGRPDGSGLGLALAREIAGEHGGELRHGSRPGDTTFTLLLPLERSS
jgi:two-component system nitrogen regulation sensor histidine kinase GlnL